MTEPSELDKATLDSLRAAGWGLCHVEMPDFMKTGTIPQYTLSYSKLFVWNMTSYEAVLWLDSDCLVVRSLHPVLVRANRSKGKVFHTMAFDKAQFSRILRNIPDSRMKLSLGRG